MSNWAYVALAYTVVWGSLALYAVILARRVAQTRESTRRLRDMLAGEEQREQRENAVCDTPPVP